MKQRVRLSALVCVSVRGQGWVAFAQCLPGSLGQELAQHRCDYSSRMIASARLEFPWCKVCGERGKDKSVKVRGSPLY